MYVGLYCVKTRYLQKNVNLHTICPTKVETPVSSIYSSFECSTAHRLRTLVEHSFLPFMDCRCCAGKSADVRQGCHSRDELCNTGIKRPRHLVSVPKTLFYYQSRSSFFTSVHKIPLQVFHETPSKFKVTSIFYDFFFIKRCNTGLP